ncbi:muscle M-line assembly protein unc-89-like [Saccostrea echinata]|uniref:muscle M-line assembly protein unc-89-like n=1 Tax=Saccostrea echinata TaxID=191078 RepID=UPI002A83B1A2|nr:muscle M-line assembly protein unc-89-like [Saccostrea echinata]
MGCIKSKCASPEERNGIKNARRGPPRGIRRIANLFRKTRIQPLNIQTSDDSPYNSFQDPPEIGRELAEPSKETRQGENDSSPRDHDCLEMEELEQPCTSTDSSIKGVTQPDLQDFGQEDTDGESLSRTSSDHSDQEKDRSSMSQEKSEFKAAKEKTKNPKTVSFSVELEEIVSFSVAPEEDKERRDIVVVLPSCSNLESQSGEEHEIQERTAPAPCKKARTTTGTRPRTAQPRISSTLPTSGHSCSKESRVHASKVQKEKKSKQARCAQGHISSPRKPRPKSSRPKTPKKDRNLELAYKWKSVQKWMKRFTDTVERADSRPKKPRAKSAPANASGRRGRQQPTQEREGQEVSSI